MGYSLRKRLSKRTPGATEVKSDSTTDTAPPLLDALDHLQPPASTSKEDPNSTPPPPAHLMLPRTPDNARESPAASLLERYKERTPIAKAPAMPSPSEVLMMARSKIPAFSDDFDDHKDLALTPTPSRSEAPTDTAPIKSTIRTVGGVDFQMVNAAQADLPQPRTSTAEPTRAASSELEDDTLQGQRRRLTRSQSKKEERSDSTIGDIGSETPKDHSDTAATPNNNGDVKIETEDKEAANAESETPPARKVVKKEPSNPSTPTKTKPKTSRFLRLSSSNRNKKEDKTSSPTLPTPTSHTAENSTSNSSSSSPSSSVNFILDSTTAQIGPAHNYQATNPDATEPLPTTRVIPPVLAFHDQIQPGWLWASPLSATSRPATPWTWCKRWTCCRCAAGTIVEQSVCSKLACGHRRCGGHCVLSEGRRVATL